MSNLIESREHKGYTINIYPDDDPQDPRDFDNLGIMLCWHNRYDLGDEHSFKSDQFTGWNDVHDYIQKELEGIIILPLYMYDHSGIGMSVSNSQYPYNCPWDSGQVGFIYTTRAKILECYEVKRLSQDIITKAEKVLHAEVDIYHKYISGDVYGYTITGPGNVIHGSCWGFYDVDEMEREAQGEIDYTLEQEKELCLMY